MKKEIDKMYEQEPKTWYAKILVALIVAALLAWSMSTRCKAEQQAAMGLR